MNASEQLAKQDHAWVSLAPFPNSRRRLRYVAPDVLGVRLKPARARANIEDAIEKQITRIRAVDLLSDDDRLARLEYMRELLIALAALS